MAVELNLNLFKSNVLKKIYSEIHDSRTNNNISAFGPEYTVDSIVQQYNITTKNINGQLEVADFMGRVETFRLIWNSMRKHLNYEKGDQRNEAENALNILVKDLICYLYDYSAQVVILFNDDPFGSSKNDDHDYNKIMEKHKIIDEKDKNYVRAFISTLKSDFMVKCVEIMKSKLNKKKTMSKKMYIFLFGGICTIYYLFFRS